MFMPLQIVRQDITKMQVDAIVNTTNEEMIGYSGVDLSVHEAAGPLLDEECERIRPLGLGEVKLTEGFNLPAKYIIHTSGPIWQGGLYGESIILKSCYVSALKLCVEKGFSSVAFPLISSGAYGYPKDKVLKYAIQIITEFLDSYELQVYLCVFDRNSYEFSKALYDEISDFLKIDAPVPEILCCSAPLIDESDTGKNKKSFFRKNIKEKAVKADTKKTSVEISDESSLYNDSDSISFYEYMKNMDKPFAYKLFDFIDSKGLTDVECYKKANVDKKTFSKIKCNPDTYKPSKQTAVAFAIALKLNLDETLDLLACAGLTLSRSFTFDKIIRYFIENGNYNIYEINEALFEFDQVLLGC